ncbi:DUF805 domain-containing protein [Chitinimonas arctica]|uniref:DUF805 domain-containing protein n=1 Tax=Chitinimonas arctica TaxID=2594795 RepID=UPI0015D39FB3|nr:DUF805 domain-containing protein [Chitinimonas arctica]
MSESLADPLLADRPQRRRLPWPSGRVGRIRYIARALGLTILCATLFSLLATFLIASTSPPVGLPILNLARIVLFGVVLPAGLLFWSIERVHDMGWPGWSAVLLLAFGWLAPQLAVWGGALKLLHLLNLLLWVWPGQRRENRFGPEPAPASLAITLLVAVAITCLLLFSGYSRLNGPHLPPKPVKPGPVMPIYPD